MTRHPSAPTATWRLLISAVALGVLASITTTTTTIATVTSADTAAAAGAPTLRQLGTARGLHMGTAVTSHALADPTDPLYPQVLAREYAMGTPENEMKFAAVHPAPGVYDFSAADAEVAFMQAHGMDVRGHNLVWGKYNPDWLTKGGYSHDQLVAIMHDHIQTEVTHYKGQITQWDVVNEAVSWKGTGETNVWSTGIGYPDYLDQAFIAARAADPSARLYYNDYAIEKPGPKFDAVFALVSGMKARGVPIDGVGFQAHAPNQPCPASCVNGLLANMVRLSTIGIEVSVTELDVAVSLPATPEALATQADMYRGLLTACLLAPNCTAFVTWGFTDRHSWIPSFQPGKGAALPFDESYLAKPAYDAMVETLLEPPVAPTCSDYATQADAQAALTAKVIGAPLLDPDADGVACPDLPAASAPLAAQPVVASPALTG